MNGDRLAPHCWINVQPYLGFGTQGRPAPRERTQGKQAVHSALKLAQPLAERALGAWQAPWAGEGWDEP